MGLLEILLGSLDLIMSWTTMGAIFMGLVWGTVMGAIPGLGIVLAIAIGIPFTLMLGPVDALAFLLATYESAMYGGSISAILIGAPGTPASAATVFDGYPMTKKGQAGKALDIALYASVFGNLIGEVILILVAAHIAKVALKFGPAETFSLIVFALTIIASTTGKNLPKGYISATIGFLIAMVGMDEVTGSYRFTFNTLDLQSGIGMIPLLVGIFAMSELILMAESRLSAETAVLKKSPNPEDNRTNFKEMKKEFRVLIESSSLGVFLGALPGLGGTVASFIAYGNAQHRSKDPEAFGTGIPRGIVAAEGANNGTCGGALIPLLTLGIPGDISTSVLLGAFMIHGLRPGPMLFVEHPIETYAIFLTLIINSFMLLFIAKAGLKIFIRFLNITKQTLIPIVLLLCFVGTYSVSTSFFDLGLLIFFGIVGYFLRKLQIPLTPFLIAYILEPFAEYNFMRSLIIGDNNPLIFVIKPISAVFLILSVASVVFTVYRRRKETS
jgi:putative tricarboxylic transport membrane protein